MSNKPFDWRRNLISIAVAQFLTMTGMGFTLPLIPFYIRDRLGVVVESERSMWVGLFAATGNLALGLFAPFWGFIADIYGRRKMMLRANFASMVLLPSLLLAPSPAWLVALRFVSSSFAGTVGAAQAMVASTTPTEKLGMAMGTITSVVGSGNMLGMLLGALVVDHYGYEPAFFTSGLLLGIAGLLVLFGTKENFVRTTTLRNKLRGARFAPPKFGGLWLLLILLAVTGFVSAFERPFVPQLVELVVGHDRAKFWTSLTLAGSALAAIIAGTVMGRLADRYTPPRVGFVSTLLAGVMAVPLGLAFSLPMLIGARMAMIFCAAGLDPVFQIWLARRAPLEQRALFLGWGSSFRAGGWFFCSMAAGGVAMLGGVRMVFFVAAACFLLLAPCIRHASRRIEM